MRILSKKTIREFGDLHPDAKEALQVWYRRAQIEDWNTPTAVTMLWPRASTTGQDRVVFRIRGNKYRLVVKVNYRHRMVYIRFIGTQAEYDRINVEEV